MKARPIRPDQSSSYEPKVAYAHFSALAVDCDEEPWGDGEGVGR